ncbi:hypothetical protein [Halomicrobium sp. LC1Hm]|nr:hypothetical protein [Halomicrobium sp. LC1Hm]
MTEKHANEDCQLPECDNNRLMGAHYCSAECEAKAARHGIRVTGAPGSRE